VDKNVRILNRPGFIFAKNDIGCLIPKTAKDVQDVSDPIDVVKHLIEVVDHEDLLELYEIPDFTGHIEFLENISKTNKLMIKVLLYL
jgi:hypothetical protein